ncbi:MAG: hypothetical protein AAF203_07675, partial [Pseudomonadota bacterium]
MVLIIQSLISLFMFGFAQQPKTQEIPMRIDLGVERCETRCKRTPFLGENINVAITMIKDWPEMWEGSWQGDISYDGQTYRGSVEIFVEATPNGYVFRVTSEVEGSRHVDWLPNMGVLRINETQDQDPRHAPRKGAVLGVAQATQASPAPRGRRSLRLPR